MGFGVHYFDLYCVHLSIDGRHTQGGRSVPRSNGQVYGREGACNLLNMHMLFLMHSVFCV